MARIFREITAKFLESFKKKFKVFPAHHPGQGNVFSFWAFNAFRAAAITLLDPSKPTKHYTVGSLRVEAPEEEDDMEDELEDDKNVKISGGIVPGIAISPPEYATQGVQLVDNGADLPVICQSFRVKTSLALPSK